MPTLTPWWLERAPRVSKVPCRCLWWHHDPKTMWDGRHTTWQILPVCVLHRDRLADWRIAELEAEIATAKEYATSAHPWQAVLRERLGALLIPQATRGAA